MIRLVWMGIVFGMVGFVFFFLCSGVFICFQWRQDFDEFFVFFFVGECVCVVVRSQVVFLWDSLNLEEVNCVGFVFVEFRMSNISVVSGELDVIMVYVIKFV